MENERDAIELATSVLKSQTWASSPTVSRLRTDVRSGENFLLATSGNLPDLFVGAMIVEWGFEVPREQSDTFHKWLAENEKSLASEYPAGVQYRGTYGVFAQSDRLLGSYRTIWAFDSLGAMELLAKEVAERSSFGARLRDLTGFRDESIGASRSQQIYQPAASSQRT